LLGLHNLIFNLENDLIRTFSLLLIFYICSVFDIQAETRDDKGKRCEKHWEQLSTLTHPPNYNELMKKWQNLNVQCSGTGIYEFRLATLYERIGQLEKAKDIIERAITSNYDYQHFLKLGKSLFQFITLVTNKVHEQSPYNDVENDYKELIKEKPKWVLPYEQLANTQLYNEKIVDAIESAQKAIELDPNSWMGFRVLVLGLAHGKEYETAKQFIVKAIQLNDALLAETEFMYAAALSYIKTGDLETAEQSLLVLLERNPAVRNDKMFQKIVDYLKAKQSEENKNAK
jgi:tetratricopeptide (TPR) repeat protein